MAFFKEDVVHEGRISYSAPGFGYINLKFGERAFFTCNDTVDLCRNLKIDYPLHSKVVCTLVPMHEIRKVRFRAQRVQKATIPEEETDKINRTISGFCSQITDDKVGSCGFPSETNNADFNYGAQDITPQLPVSKHCISSVAICGNDSLETFKTNHTDVNVEKSDQIDSKKKDTQCQTEIGVDVEIRDALKTVLRNRDVFNVILLECPDQLNTIFNKVYPDS